MDGSMRVRCACGWEVVGAEDEVVAATQEHGRRLHNMVATRDEVLGMAVGAAGGGKRATPRRAKPRAR